MKGMVKAIIAGVIIIVIGAGILIAGLAIGGWTVEPNFEMHRFEATEVNTSLKVDFGAGALKTEYYDGEKIAIDYPVASRLEYKITERDGKLTFKSSQKGWFINFGKWNIPDTVIYLPRGIAYNIDFDLGAGSINLVSGTYGTVEIEVGAGMVNLNDCECTSFEGKVSAGLLSVNSLNCQSFTAKVSAGKFAVTALTCPTFDAKVSAGKLEVKSVDCPNIKTSVSAGSVEIGVNGKKSEYNISSSVSAGSCNLSNQFGTTDKKIDCHVSAGSIIITFTEN